MVLRTMKRLLYIGGLIFIGYTMRGCFDDCHGQTMNSYHSTGSKATIENVMQTENPVLQESPLEKIVYKK